MTFYHRHLPNGITLLVVKNHPTQEWVLGATTDDLDGVAVIASSPSFDVAVMLGAVLADAIEAKPDMLNIQKLTNHGQVN